MVRLSFPECRPVSRAGGSLGLAGGACTRLLIQPACWHHVSPWGGRCPSAHSAAWSPQSPPRTISLQTERSALTLHTHPLKTA